MNILIFIILTTEKVTSRFMGGKGSKKKKKKKKVLSIIVFNDKITFVTFVTENVNLKSFRVTEVRGSSSP